MSHTLIWVPRTLSAGELSVRPNNNSVVLLISPPSFFLSVACEPSASPSILFSFGAFLRLNKRKSRSQQCLKKKSVLKCKRRWCEVGVWLLIFSKGFQSGLLPAIATFSNVTCCLLGKNKLPLLREVLLKIVRTDPWAHTYSTHTCLISGHSLEAMWHSDMCI